MKTYSNCNKQRNVQSCRLCLAIIRNGPVFNISCTRIADLIYYCVDLHVDADDSFPGHICAVCYKTLKEIESFKSKSHAADQWLRSKHEKSIQDSAKDCSVVVVENGVEGVIIVEGSSSDTLEKHAKCHENVFGSELILEGKGANVLEGTSNDTVLASSSCTLGNLIETQSILKNMEVDTTPISNKYGSIDIRLDSSKVSDLCIESYEIFNREELNRKRLIDVEIVKRCEKNVMRYRRAGAADINAKDQILDKERLHYSEFDDKNVIVRHDRPEKTTIRIHREGEETDQKVKVELCENVVEINVPQPRKKLKNNKEDSKNHSNQCPICGQVFSFRSSLKRHMATHTGEKNYSCLICNKSFNQAALLQRHSFTHAVLKPFQCKLCEKRFTQKQYLRNHLALIHQHIRLAFTCKECGRIFKHASSLSRHSRTHKPSPDKPCLEV